jgi:hypothetical protein
LKKIGTGAVVATVGALLTYATQIITDIDFGQATPLVMAAFSVIANVVRKWLTDYSTTRLP